MADRTPREHRWPVLTLAVILVDLGVAALSLFRPETVDVLAFYPDRPVVWQAVTSLFVHANTVHLLGNLVFLAAVGPLVELSKGPARTALVFLASGVVGVAAHWAFARGTGSLVGASGAIAGCVGYASVAYMGKRVAVAPNVGAPVWVLALVWLVAQAVGMMMKAGDGGAGASFSAHLGGFLAGILVAAACRVWRDQNVSLGHEVLERLNSQGPVAALAAAEAHLAKHPDDVVAHRQAARAMLDLGRSDQATKQWWHMAWACPGHAAEAVREVARLDGWRAETSVRRLRLAATLEATDPETSGALLRSVAEGPTDDPERPNALLALALAAPSPESASAFAARLAEDYALHPATEVARHRGLLP
ncbi:MAG: rhomboid family intramembrane serine protease [Fimbriimonadaceae bacterium]|nr:rhomboid family intramembrane serine protease [Fimbriimonadaceae bacterium]